MKAEKLQSTGTEIIDQLLCGGIEHGVITTVYGPAGSGKTNISLLITCNVIKNGGKVLFIDTEGSFSVSRVTQIQSDFLSYAKNIHFFRPFNFDEQKRAFLQLKETIERKPDEYQLIVVDSIAMLYRLEIGKTLDVSFVNRELGIQLGLLTEISRKYNIPVLIINQVYADFDNRDSVRMVGGDLLKYTSKCLIELKKGLNGIRIARIIKHRSIAEGKEVAFKIIETGLQSAQIASATKLLEDDEKDTL